MNGGLWENTSAYVNNGNNNLKIYGLSMKTENNKSNKYITIYDANEISTTDEEKAVNNYEVNSFKYGDAINETSLNGNGFTSWYSGVSNFPENTTLFFARSGCFDKGGKEGLFIFSRNNGIGAGIINHGFRVTLI